MLRYIQRNIVSLDNSVGVAIRYGLDGPGIESRWRRDFNFTFYGIILIVIDISSGKYKQIWKCKHSLAVLVLFRTSYLWSGWPLVRMLLRFFRYAIACYLRGTH